ncbi:M23 family metallopeptidase [Breznakiella homolactica]|uniref:M23 family metallopeptidase n=1 Tax=Breznakiella homolactica TaxID=2798577 RepID=A0A7T8BD76_9SPIR|nr:M23 family metallopeptidase [Breznakiella homolactica]QQO10968.1 M23 family metallopeptidase [Breznakiella homolactica]
MKKKLPLFLLILWFLPLLIPADETDLSVSFPRILRLESGDTGFKQYQSNVEYAYRRIADLERRGSSAESILEDLTIFSYIPRQEDDIFKVAARCNVPYAALATLNRFGHPSSLGDAALVLLPSIPGIFIPQNPESDLELVMAAARDPQQGFPVTITRNGKTEQFRFLPGGDFSPTERAFFLNTSFRFPLRNYRLTSTFGPRINPVTGNMRFHEGFDLAAPEGTDVFAARDGIVTDTGEDPIFGKYIIIQHGETWFSLYGHLSVILADLRSSVQSGTLIGRVGSTGQSTGPHLHFELRQNGKAQDPGKYLFREGINR